MSEKLNRANRILDRACKSAGLDPVEVRIALVNSIRDKQREANGSGFARQGPNTTEMLRDD